MEFIKLLTGTAKTLMCNKTFQQILKYISSATLTYAGKKFLLPQYKYDVNDNRNMIYQHNQNNHALINPLLADEIYNLHKIDRFIQDLAEQRQKENLSIEGLTAEAFLDNIGKILQNQKHIDELKYHYRNDPTLLSFDHDTLETSSIADTNEINSGGIYVPVKNLPILTDEGKNVADAKNDYLEKRILLGNKATDEDLVKLLKDYHKTNKTKEVMEYFNSFGVK